MLARKAVVVQVMKVLIFSVLSWLPANSHIIPIAILNITFIIYARKVHSLRKMEDKMKNNAFGCEHARCTIEDVII